MHRAFKAGYVFFILICAGFSLLSGNLYAEDFRDVRSLIKKSGFVEKNISQSEIDQLAAGEPIFTFLQDMDGISLSPDSVEGQEILERYKEIEPNFLIESFFILPLPEQDSAQTLNEAERFLMDISQFEGVPYWSEEHEKYFDLFSEIEILERKTFDDESRGIVVEQKMKPFKPHKALYRYWRNGSDFIYTSKNTEAIRYKLIKAVREENMVTSLFVHAEPEALVFYGVGGVQAFTFFGMFGERMETSFTGRTEAFFRWFHEEFVVPRIK
ncbi:MAG: hypothetical protein K9L66_06615 [Spirochaetaceae bacterium]|nr:hypothetical protein [Spirochaetaceae bacterium]